MGQMITVTGLVLAAYPYGDYDKRITVLTKGAGKDHGFRQRGQTAEQPASGCLTIPSCSENSQCMKAGVPTI